MNSTKKAARVAGLVYVLMSIPGGFSLLYIPSVLLVPGDATATVNKIQTSKLQRRGGTVTLRVADCNGR